MLGADGAQAVVAPPYRRRPFMRKRPGARSSARRGNTTEAVRLQLERTSSAPRPPSGRSSFMKVIGFEAAGCATGPSAAGMFPSQTWPWNRERQGAKPHRAARSSSTAMKPMLWRLCSYLGPGLPRPGEGSAWQVRPASFETAFGLLRMTKDSEIAKKKTLVMARGWSGPRRARLEALRNPSPRRRPRRRGFLPRPGPRSRDGGHHDVVRRANGAHAPPAGPGRRCAPRSPMSSSARSATSSSGISSAGAQISSSCQAIVERAPPRFMPTEVSWCLKCTGTAILISWCSSTR